MLRAAALTTVTFGLVTIPVKIYTTASDNAVKFNLITPKGNRVALKAHDAVTDEVVDRSTCSHGYEFAKDQFVTFMNDELDALALPSTKTVEIKEFVPADLVDTLFIEKSYFLGPDKGAAKSYSLLAAALRNTGKVAVAQWSTRGREHLVTIRPYKNGLAMSVMFYADEQRDPVMFETGLPIGNNGLPVTDNEFDLALKIVGALTSEEYDPSKYRDRYRDTLQAAVDTKISSKDRVIAGTPETSALDLLATLKSSLEQAKPKGKKPRTRKAT